MRKTKQHVGQVVGAVMLFLAAMAAPVEAYDFADCTEICTSNCRLTADVSCNNQDGIILTNGADLNMNNHTLTCTANCPNSAVVIASGNSMVFSGIITGQFNYAVNCAGSSNSEVFGVEINSATVGISECAKVSYNVVTGDLRANTIGIETTGVANSDYIDSNFVKQYTTGIYVYSNTNIDVQNNLVTVRNVAGTTVETGIFASVSSGTPDVSVVNNGLNGSATNGQYYVPVGAVFSAYNFCDGDDLLCQQCNYCYSQQ